MTAGGEGGARARPLPSYSAAGAELVLAGKARSTSRAWRAERWARPVLDLASWGLTRSADHFLWPPRPFQTPASLLGCTLASVWGCQLPLRDVLPWRAASLSWWVAYETVYSARAGPESRALWVILGHPSLARVPGSEGRQDLGRSLRHPPLLCHRWVFFVLS